MNAPMTKAEVIAARDVTALTILLRSEFEKGKNNITIDLKSCKGWVLWRITEINPTTGKFNKIPIYPNSRKNRHGEQGSSEDLTNLATWEEAYAAFSSDKSLAGIGFALLPSFNIVALDVDHCVSDDKVREDSDLLTSSTYCEVSPSGTGIRAFWQGVASDGKNHDKGYELFHSKGFVTVTGNRIENIHFLFDSERIQQLDSGMQAEWSDYRARLEKLAKSISRSI